MSVNPPLNDPNGMGQQATNAMDMDVNQSEEVENEMLCLRQGWKVLCAPSNNLRSILDLLRLCNPLRSLRRRRGINMFLIRQQRIRSHLSPELQLTNPLRCLTYRDLQFSPCFMDKNMPSNPFMYASHGQPPIPQPSVHPGYFGGGSMSGYGWKCFR